MNEIDKGDDIVEEDLSQLDESTDWKSKAQELEQKRREDGIRSRERTKALKDKLAEIEAKIPEKVTKPDDELLKRLDKLALKTAGITEADEVELFEKWRTETGREAESVIDNSIFVKELSELRTARANLAATSDVKGEAGESGARATPEYWIAKATKGNDGKLLFPEETPKELYSKIVDTMMTKDSLDKNKLKFYNE